MIEPIINAADTGAIINPAIIPAGERSPKKKQLTPAVAINAPQESDRGCKRNSGTFPENSEASALPGIKIPAKARYERIKERVLPEDGVKIICIKNDRAKTDTEFFGNAPRIARTPRRYMIAARLRLGVGPTRKQ
jgi:hypothetical protein